MGEGHSQVCDLVHSALWNCGLGIASFASLGPTQPVFYKVRVTTGMAKSVTAQGDSSHLME